MADNILADNSQDDILKTYAYHAPSEEGLEKIIALRKAYSVLHLAILDLAAGSRERSLALTDLEASSGWAFKSVAVNDPDSEVCLSSHPPAKDESPSDDVAPDLDTTLPAIVDFTFDGCQADFGLLPEFIAGSPGHGVNAVVPERSIAPRFSTLTPPSWTPKAA